MVYLYCPTLPLNTSPYFAAISGEKCRLEDKEYKNKKRKSSPNTSFAILIINLNHEGHEEHEEN
jgi:hypothetical protein